VPVDAAPTVLVDARNVLRSKWPNIPDHDLVEFCRAWADDHELDAIVVFDGRAPGGLVGERQEGARLMLVGTGSESADDWIARRASADAAAGRPYWLVTSDRGLRERAGAGAGRTIGGGSFARELTGSE
jgi:hypothetical protein